MIPRRLLPLCWALAVLISSGSPAHAQVTQKIKRVAHVTLSGATSSASGLNGVYELWDATEKGNGAPSYRFAGWVGDRLLVIGVSFNSNGDQISCVFTQGVTTLGTYLQGSNPSLPATLTYTTKQAYMPATVDVDIVEEPDEGGGGGGSVSISNWGSTPDDMAVPSQEPEIPDLEEEEGPGAPTMTHQFGTNPFSGGVDSEYPTPRPGDIEIGWDPLDLPEIESDYLTFNVPMPDMLVAHGAPYITLSTNPLASFGAGPGGIYTKLDLVRQGLRVILSFGAFMVFVRALQHILVFA